jgi:hypothetical protein
VWKSGVHSVHFDTEGHIIVTPREIHEKALADKAKLVNFVRIPGTSRAIPTHAHHYDVLRHIPQVMGVRLNNLLLRGSAKIGFSIALVVLLIGLIGPQVQALTVFAAALLAGVAGGGSWWLVCGKTMRGSLARTVGAAIVVSLLWKPALPVSMSIIPLRSFLMDIIIPYALTNLAVVGRITLPVGVAAFFVCLKLVLRRSSGKVKIAGRPTALE